MISSLSSCPDSCAAAAQISIVDRANNGKNPDMTTEFPWITDVKSVSDQSERTASYV